MSARIQLVAILASAVLLLAVLEMVRRRRLMERYALLWLLSGVVLLALASWPGALSKISKAIGIFYPPTALFIVAFIFVLLLLLHFSSVVSRLSDQTKVLAQRLALLEERQRRLDEPPAEDETEAPSPAPRTREERRRYVRITSD
ncbi:MAG: DUF2304 domain-containing protein [Solirubrobacteraceae bacterium]